METQNIEYKESWRDEYLKWICGFANAQGGTLFIGKNDRGEVVGVRDAKKLMEDIPNKVANAMGIVVDVNIYSEKDKQYISIETQPSALTISCKGKFYYRSGATLQELTGFALQDFLLKKMERTWDSQIVEHSSFDDIDTETVDYFLLNGIRTGRITKSAQNDTLKKIFRNLQLVDENDHLTIAALLLFGKHPQNYCLNARFRIGRFGATPSDLLSQDIIDCNLIQMVDKVMEVLNSKYLIRPIHYEGMHRVEPLEIPEDALREILFNAIVHKDYRGPDIQMKVYSDRIRLWNFGSLLGGYTIEQLWGEHDSIQRNPLIAQVFYLAGFIETWGRGFYKIEQGFSKEGLQLPSYEETEGGVLTIIQREKYLRQIGKVAEKVAEKVTEKVTGKVTGKRAVVIDQIKNNPQITIPDLMIVLSMSDAGVRKMMKQMKDANLIRRIGPKKGGHWEVI
jgi:ATP-dependent DNA helicase RecG